MKKYPAQKLSLTCDLSVSTLLALVDINGHNQRGARWVRGGCLRRQQADTSVGKGKQASVSWSILEIVAPAPVLVLVLVRVDRRAATVWRQQPEGVSAPSGKSSRHIERLRANLQSKACDLDLISRRQHSQPLTARGAPAFFCTWLVTGPPNGTAFFTLSKLPVCVCVYGNALQSTASVGL